MNRGLLGKKVFDRRGDYLGKVDNLLISGLEIYLQIAVGVRRKKYCLTGAIKKFWDTEGQLSITVNEKELVDKKEGNKLKNMPVYDSTLFMVGKVKDVVLDKEELKPVTLLVVPVGNYHYRQIELKEIECFGKDRIKLKK